jgi:uncharacterized membrane protein
MASKQPPAPLAPRLNFPIFLVALFGILVVIHLYIQLERGFTHGCLGFSAPTGEIAECAGVVGSELGTVGGVSNVFLGLLFYVILAALRLGVALVKPPLSRTLQQASFAVVGFGMLYAGWLVGAQVFILNEYCVLCLISAATTTVLFGLHVFEWRSGRPTPRKSEPAVVSAVSFKPYALGLAALVLVVAADFAFMSDGAGEAPLATVNGETPVRPTAGQLATACQFDPEMTEFRLFDMLAGGRTPFKGSEDASIRFLKIFDPNCPHCATLHGLLEQVIPQQSDNARFYYQPVALWEWSIPQIQAMYIARETGTDQFFEMVDLQLEHQVQGPIPVETLVTMAEQIGLDGEAFVADIRRGRFADVIRQERQMVFGAGVSGVPRLIVDGRPIANTQQTWTTECLNYFAERASR